MHRDDYLMGVHGGTVTLKHAIADPDLGALIDSKASPDTIAKYLNDNWRPLGTQEMLDTAVGNPLAPEVAARLGKDKELQSMLTLVSIRMTPSLGSRRKYGPTAWKPSTRSILTAPHPTPKNPVMADRWPKLAALVASLTPEQRAAGLFGNNIAARNRCPCHQHGPCGEQRRHPG